MKTLPDNPHLDHLRRQAKDLLAGLRDTRPEATLAEAQTSLAQQYGFRSWTDLKAEVDRGRGGAVEAGHALAEQITTRYGLGPVIVMRSLARPDEMGRRWLLETALGRWAVRTVDDVYPVTDGEENTRFQEAALGAGVTVPRPVRSLDGRVVEEVGGNRWRVYESVPSGPPLAAPVSAAVTRQVGELLAIVHGLHFPADGICPWNDRRLTSRSWAELADLATAKGAGWAPVLVSALPALAELQSIGDGHADTTEPVLCHNNFNPGNVRAASGSLVVSGWEHAGGLPPEWELAAVLANWAVDPNGGVNLAGARALLDGYRSRSGTTRPVRLTDFRGTAIALQNYVAGQVDLALNAADDEDARYADRNVRHLLTHLPTLATFEELARLR
ncbi:phosphotransferase [Paractinoplanes brasiliensis]|uniref:Ser/Thr protein kinase RdoA (MazF antagonist) n=1 Tax=Paractinoplanes brasiliensis TaxID=52695 RepID=A0A4R6JVP6_9ACTN|nr:phosphotransferase [Actinoplanes brasiliensis]TDO40833.1 Ser/Thr protein kinase RdoA (MazF antagonist) [Actinoplanes brasiliensis]